MEVEAYPSLVGWTLPRTRIPLADSQEATMRQLLFSLTVVVMAATLCHAQHATRAASKPSRTLHAVGRVHSLTPNVINMFTTASQPWQIQITEKTLVSVKGPGTPEMLRPGVGIRFEAVLTKRGAALEPIEELTIFSPPENFVPVVEIVQDEVEEGGPAGTTEVKEDQPKRDGSEEKQGEGQADGEAAIPPSETSTERDDQEQNDQAPEEPVEQPPAARDSGKGRKEEGERYFVAGLLIQSRRGKLVVDVGDAGKIRAEVAENAEIHADFITHLAARPGDTIEVKGRYSIAGQGIARTVTITLIRPPEAVVAKGEDRPRSTRGGDRDEEHREKVPAFGDPG